MLKFDSQLRYANKLEKWKKLTTMSSAMERNIDLPLSSEMITWMNDSIELIDENGYLDNTVSSVLSKPLDSMSLFCPIASLITSKYTSSKPPSMSPAYKDENIYDEELSRPETTAETSAKNNKINKTTIGPSKPSSSSNGTIQDVASRLNIMWLQRKAKTERGEGYLDEAFNTLQEAIDAHIGTDDYSKANLSGKVSTDPLEVLESIQSDFFVFDNSAHQSAARIQRLYCKHYRMRYKASSTISKHFRGFLVRRDKWTKNTRLRQCAVRIQRRFRIHLARMHALATKIKRFYRMRKDVKKYLWRLYFYQTARRVQRLFRGIVGRRIADIKRSQFSMTLKLQRNSRGYLSRRSRGYAIKMYHRMFFRAARKIQTRVRVIQAVHRAQVKLLKEIAREEQRVSREKQIVSDAISLEIAKTKSYLRSIAGRYHFNKVLQFVQLREDDFQKRRPDLSDEDILANEAITCFELFDVDGSGSIDEVELAGMLKELCIPLSKRGVRMLAAEIDTRGNGSASGGGNIDININDFIDWYCNGLSSSSSSSVDGEESEPDGGGAVGDAMFKNILQARRIAMEITGMVSTRRAEREVLRQCTAWLSKDLISSFRVRNAPKFQCCQCLEPFVLFTDYFSHFDSDGLCCVLKEKALFYRNFCSQTDWTKQRQCEHEIMRFNNEMPYVNHCIMKSSYDDLSLQKDKDLSKLLKHRMKSAKAIFLDKLENDTSKVNKSLAQRVMDIIDFCKDQSISRFVAWNLGDCLHRELPIKCILSDNWDFNTILYWASDLVDRKHILKSRFQLTRRGKLGHQAAVLGKIYVKTLRQLQIEIESSLLALTEFRERRIRRITIDDGELIAMGLEQLTEQHFSSIKSNIMNKLVLVNDAMKEVLIYEQKSCLHSIRNLLRYSKITPKVRSEVEIIQELQLEEAKTIARAKVNLKLLSKAGQYHLNRISNELWALKRHILSENRIEDSDTGSYPQQQLARLKYIFKLYSVPDLNENFIDIFDLKDFLRDHLIFLTEDEMNALLNELDPYHMGYFMLDEWLTCYENIIRSKKEMKLFDKLTTNLIYLQNSFREYFLKADAKRVMAISLQKQCRAELFSRNLLVQILLLKNLPENEIENVLENGNSVENPLENENENKSLLPLPRSRSAVLGILGELEGKYVIAQERVESLRQFNERTDFRMYSQFAQKQADDNFYGKLLSRRGLKDIKMERRFIQASDNMVEAYGHLIPSSDKSKKRSISSYLMKYLCVNTEVNNDEQGDSITIENSVSINNVNKSQQAWQLLAEIVAYTFDTDCSGSFDEKEIRFKLSSIYSGLSQKKTFFSYPDARLGFASPKTLTNSLLEALKYSDRSIWPSQVKRRLRIRRVSITLASISLMSSLARQMTNDKIMQVNALTSKNKATELINDNFDNSKSLIIRSQIFAIRQVNEFLKTPFGKLEIKRVKIHIKDCWQRHVITSDFNQLDVLKYTYHIHCDNNRLLVTELPYIIRFLVDNFNLKVNLENNSTKAIVHRLLQISSKLSLRWLSEMNFLKLFRDYFVPWSYEKATRWMRRVYFNSSCSFRGDAVSCIYARARQQAVQISMRCDNINAGETNYRCSVLGLDDVIKRKSQSAVWGVFRRKPTFQLNWRRAPREAITFLLISKGFSYEELYFGTQVSKVAGVTHVDGSIASSQVFVSSAIAIARNEVKRTVSKRVLRGFRVLNRVEAYIHYFRIAKCIKLYGDEINSSGASYLNEIMIGVSNSISEGNYLN